MRNESEEGAFCSYAVVQIRGQKEEDCFWARLSHANPQEGGLKSVASFGVFDGHSSRKAADECSKSLNKQTVMAYAELLTTTGLVGTLGQMPNKLVNSDVSRSSGADLGFLSPVRGIAGSTHSSQGSTSGGGGGGGAAAGQARPVNTPLSPPQQRARTRSDSSSDESAFKKDAEVWQNAGKPEPADKKLGDTLDASNHSEGGSLGSKSKQQQQQEGGGGSKDLDGSNHSGNSGVSPFRETGDDIDISAHSVGTNSTTLTGNMTSDAARTSYLPPHPMLAKVQQLHSSAHGTSPATSAHGLSASQRAAARNVSSSSATEAATRDRELLKDNILLSAKQMCVYEVHDALLVESVLKETYNLDKKVKSMTTSGTTSVALYLRKQADGSVRAICSNVGDSRCVCITAVSSLVETDPPSSSSSKSATARQAKAAAGGKAAEGGAAAASAEEAGAGAGINPNSHYHDLLLARNADLDLSSMLRDSSHGDKSGGGSSPSLSSETDQQGSALDALPPFLYAVRTAVSTAFLMSEDHNLSLPRERLRIMSKSLPPWSTLPVESFEPYLPTQMRSGLLLSSSSEPVSIFEVGALIARRANPYPDGPAGAESVAAASYDTGQTSGDTDSSQASGTAGRALGAVPKWNSSVHLSAVAERESELESELMRRSNSQEFVFGSSVYGAGGSSSGDLPSSAKAANNLEATFHKNSPKLTARKSLFTRAAERTINTVAVVEDGATSLPASSTHSTASSSAASGSNLAGAVGIGNAVLTQHARAASRQYIETAASRQVLASKFIKKVRLLMNRYGTKAVGWNGTTTKLTNARSVTELSSIVHGADDDSEYSNKTADGALVAGRPAAGAAGEAGAAGDETIKLFHEESFIARRCVATLFLLCSACLPSYLLSLLLARTHHSLPHSPPPPPRTHTPPPFQPEQRRQNRRPRGPVRAAKRVDYDDALPGRQNRPPQLRGLSRNRRCHRARGPPRPVRARVGRLLGRGQHRYCAAAGAVQEVQEQQGLGERAGAQGCAAAGAGGDPPGRHHCHGRRC